MSGTDYADRRQLMNRNQIAARGFRDEAFLSASAKAPRETDVDHGTDAGEVGADDRLLEVGAVTGYSAAVLSRPAGQVHAIKWHEALARQAAARNRELANDDCEIITGDGLKGLPNEAPFDAILVAVRFDSVPDALKR
ncbi:protein-L-isoaspartate O-methyltransferase family protein [Qipengyuania flava]|uniref:protein-L-isoaspartate O-methyltransferase family protein n=1 Tax=Qipengyuania flava TaxID=192812 RepID=UPI00273FF62E|nr:hypothetical protein [Qipengyuania flava]